MLTNPTLTEARCQGSGQLGAEACQAIARGVGRHSAMSTPPPPPPAPPLGTLGPTLLAEWRVDKVYGCRLLLSEPAAAGTGSGTGLFSWSLAYPRSAWLA